MTTDHINMRDPNRIKRILNKIEILWTIMPDQRIGQLMINIFGSHDNIGLWNTEDDKFEEILDDWISINCLDKGWKS